MGGYGSGRSGGKQKAEDCKSLDVNRLHRERCLSIGRAGHWVWSRDGEETRSTGYRMKPRPSEAFGENITDSPFVSWF